MSVTIDYYLAQAAICANEADRTSLDNVRERFLRSEAAWRAMAARLTSTEGMRERREAEKAMAADAST